MSDKFEDVLSLGGSISILVCICYVFWCTHYFLAYEELHVHVVIAVSRTLTYLTRSIFVGGTIIKARQGRGTLTPPLACHTTLPFNSAHTHIHLICVLRWAALFETCNKLFLGCLSMLRSMLALMTILCCMVCLYFKFIQHKETYVHLLPVFAMPWDHAHIYWLFGIAYMFLPLDCPDQDASHWWPHQCHEEEVRCCHSSAGAAAFATWMGGQLPQRYIGCNVFPIFPLCCTCTLYVLYQLARLVNSVIGCRENQCIHVKSAILTLHFCYCQLFPGPKSHSLWRCCVSGMLKYMYCTDFCTNVYILEVSINQPKSFLV